MGCCTRLIACAAKFYIFRGLGKKGHFANKSGALYSQMAYERKMALSRHTPDNGSIAVMNRMT